MRDKEKPSRVYENGGSMDGYVETHPSFGLISMFKTTTSERSLFGSDLKHNQVISIELHTASSRRSLSRNWHSQEKLVAKIDLSYSQFAQFITSAGDGTGVPCTFRFRAMDGHTPEIDNIETKSEIMHREVREMTKEATDQVFSKIKDLKELMDGSSISKKRLAEIIKDMEIAANNIPANMQHVQESAHENIDKFVSDAKVEIECYMDNAQKRLGISEKPISQQIERK